MRTNLSPFALSPSALSQDRPVKGSVDFRPSPNGVMVCGTLNKASNKALQPVWGAENSKSTSIVQRHPVGYANDEHLVKVRRGYPA